MSSGIEPIRKKAAVDVVAVVAVAVCAVEALSLCRALELGAVSVRSQISNGGKIVERVWRVVD